VSISVGCNSTRRRKMHSRVLIILPVFNEIKRIDRCISSLKKQDTDFCCIISDNKSTDGTFELLQDRIDKDSRFHLVRTMEHTSIISNSDNALEHALQLGIESDYLMFFAADDTLISSNYLSALSFWLDQNDTFNAVSPTIEMFNYSTKAKWEIRPSLESRFPFVRVLKWGLKNSSSGFTNFICGLMRWDTYLELQKNNRKNWNFENKGTSARAIRSEFLTYIQFVIASRVGNCNKVVLQKEIHNRTPSGDRVFGAQSIAQSRGFIYNFVHQIRSISIPFRALKLFRNEISLQEFSLLGLFSLLYFSTNFLSILQKKVAKFFQI
jgi:glycosyltransferase involved in cell wall biosynthesis